MQQFGKVWLACLLCISIRSLSYSQRGATLSIGAQTHYGFFVVNQPKSEYVRDSHTAFGELSISTATNGSKPWQQANKCPHVGVSFLCGNSGSREYIGNVAAVFPWMKFPLLKMPNATTGFRLGFGAAFVQKPYDKETNNKNMVIGTRLNGFISMVLEQEWRIQKRLFINAGFSFTHMSNGCIKLPNLGLNMPALSVGARYALRAADKQLAPEALPPMTKKWHYYAYALVAGKQSYPLQSPVYMVNSFVAEALRDASHANRYGAGLNITRDPSQNRESGVDFEFEQNDPFWQVSAFAAYERVIGNLSIPVQLGFYLYNKYQFNPMYQLVGLRYRFRPHWIGAVHLKAHLGKADYIQWGLGYRF